MDAADTQRALTGQGNLLGQHEHVIQILLHNVAALSQSMQDLSRHMVRLVNSLTSPGGDSQVDSYACDPEPFDGSLDHFRGFLLQCMLVFSQRASWFPSDVTKIDFMIGLLRGRELAWAQVASSRKRLGALSLEEFVKRLFALFG